MAWGDMIRSVMKAARILGKEVTEQDIPDSYDGLRKLHDSLWKQVYRKEAARDGRGLECLWR